MKIIVQWKPDAVEKVLYDLDESDFLVDVDTYGYFLNEVFLPGIKDYIEKKRGLTLKDTKNVEGAVAVKNMYDNQELYVKYWPEYNKIRDKFYLYKGDIYSYVFIGFGNVGHVIQIYKYDMPDLGNLLNKLTKRRKFFQRFLKWLT